MRLAPLLALLLTACVTHSQAYEQQWETERDDMMSQLVTPQCPAAYHAKKCGLIAPDLNKSFPDFIKNVCEPRKASNNECASLFVNMVMTRWRERYPYGDWAAAKEWCDANPQICNLATPDGVGMYELQLLKTHNDYIFAALKQRKTEIQQTANAEALRRQQALSNALSHMGDGLIQNSQTVNCTSNTYGATTYTNCH